MNAIKDIRDKLGLTQNELAAKLEMTQGNVGHYEKGIQDVPVRVAKKLVSIAKANGLDMSLDDFYRHVD